MTVAAGYDPHPRSPSPQLGRQRAGQPVELGRRHGGRGRRRRLLPDCRRPDGCTGCGRRATVPALRLTHDRRHHLRRHRPHPDAAQPLGGVASSRMGAAIVNVTASLGRGHRRPDRAPARVGPDATRPRSPYSTTTKVSSRTDHGTDRRRPADQRPRCRHARRGRRGRLVRVLLRRRRQAVPGDRRHIGCSTRTPASEPARARSRADGTVVVKVAGKGRVLPPERTGCAAQPHLDAA